MTKIFDKKIIFDYINGNDLDDGYTLEELEASPEFMLSVLMTTRDKEMYWMCDENVKHNYIFVTSVIDIFKSDIPFITEVAKEYLKSVPKDDITAIEVQVKIAEIAEATRDFTLHIFSLKALSFLARKMAENALVIEEAKEDWVKEELGMGFFLIRDEYGSSEIILRYAARKMLDEIFYRKNSGTLEQFLHHQYHQLTDFTNEKINNFLIGHIARFDIHLSSYVANHLELLDSIKKEIELIKYRWYDYESERNERKIAIFVQEMNRYLAEHCPEFEAFELLGYALKKLEIPGIIESDEEKSLTEGHIGDYTEPLRELMKMRDLTLTEIAALKEAVRLTKELFIGDDIKPNQDDYDMKVTPSPKGLVYLCEYYHKTDN